MDIPVGVAILSQPSRALPVGFLVGDVQVGALPAGFTLEDGPNGGMPVGVHLVSEVVRSLPLGVSLASGPSGTLPLGVLLHGPPSIRSLPVGAWMRNGGRLPFMGLVIDPGIHDRLPLTTPVEHTQMIVLEGEIPVGIDPLPA